MPSKRKGKGKPKRKSRDGNRSEGDLRTVASGLPGGFGSVRLKTVAQPDVTIVKLRYETTSAFTSTGGAASYVQIKGNSIFHPYVGNTDNPGGTARMYADYKYSLVLKSSITIRLWGGVSGQDEPFRLVVVPCNSDQYTTYSGFSNIAQLWDVPHARQKLFSPGGVLPTLKSWGTTQAVLFGNSKERGQEWQSGSLSTYAGTSGSDPTGSLWYFLIGYQNMAGTTTTNQQAQVSIEYTVRFAEPVPTPVQFTSRNKWGNEPSDSKEQKTLLSDREVKREDTRVSHTSGKSTPPAAGETKVSRQDNSMRYSLLFGSDPDPESDDPEEVLFRKMLASRLGTVPCGTQQRHQGTQQKTASAESGHSATSSAVKSLTESKVASVS